LANRPPPRGSAAMLRRLGVRIGRCQTKRGRAVPKWTAWSPCLAISSTVPARRLGNIPRMQGSDRGARAAGAGGHCQTKRHDQIKPCASPRPSPLAGSDRKPLGTGHGGAKTVEAHCDRPGPTSRRPNTCRSQWESVRYSLAARRNTLVLGLNRVRLVGVRRVDALLSGAAHRAALRTGECRRSAM